MKLRGKTAIVTGSADGIGRSIAQAMAEAGANVVIADIQEDKGREVEQGIAGDGGSAMFVPCDIGSGEQVAALIQRVVEKFGGIDIVCNNAAIDYQSPFVDMEEAVWQRVININLTGAFRLCRHAVPYMLKDGGSIVNIASVQAFMGFPTYSAYAAAKGGIVSLTRQLAVELAPHRIRVNSISPGTIRTPMTQNDLDNASDPDELLRYLAGQHALNRLGEPEEVASAAVFLASDEAAFITGTDLKVDGGLVVKPS